MKVETTKIIWTQSYTKGESCVTFGINLYGDGVVELKALFAKHDFAVDFFGSQPLKDASLVQKITRPAKKFAVKFGLIPKTMRGKQLLRRIIFGKPILMPPEIMPNMSGDATLAPLPADTACTTHKIIYCEAQKCN